ncbi:MAG: TrmH family RNA methyltransferase [Gaiellaceae bacterium]
MAGLLVLITSAHNTKLRLIRRLLGSRRQRESQGLFVCEGDDLVEAARAAGIEPVEVLVAGEDVDPALVAELSTLAHPPRVIGVYRRPDLPRGARPLTLALWHVGDPGNVGTLLRTADAFGAGVALSAGCADPTGPKALRASAGAIFRVPLAPFDEAPRPWTALVAHGAMPPDQVQGEGSFVLGAEREGLPDDVVARCDARVTIPLEPGAESLNVATAGAIALYEARRPH